MGDFSDPDFQNKIDRNHRINLILLELQKLRMNLHAPQQLKETFCADNIAGAVQFPCEEKQLKGVDVTKVSIIYTEVGTGFPERFMGQLLA